MEKKEMIQGRKRVRKMEKKIRQVEGWKDIRKKRTKEGRAQARGKERNRMIQHLAIGPEYMYENMKTFSKLLFPFSYLSRFRNTDFKSHTVQADP